MGASHFGKYLRRGEAPDGSKSLVLTNKLSAEMLRPCKIEMHPHFLYIIRSVTGIDISNSQFPIRNSQFPIPQLPLTICRYIFLAIICQITESSKAHPHQLFVKWVNLAHRRNVDDFAAK